MTPLDRLVRRLIARAGPLPVSRFMALALQHPEHGYYRQAAAIGRGGDFVTAPEISQVFGELVGLWLAGAWLDAGRPDPCLLCEAGPGRGTLMADAMRAIRRAVPDFAAALRLHLIESSATLCRAQAAALADAAPVWIDGPAGLPPGPLFLIANEFLDALPVRQFVMTQAGWRERTVALAADGRLVFAAGDAAGGELMAAGLALPARTETGTVREYRPEALAFVDAVARRIADHGGAALLIDYGGERPSGRSTLRGIRGHAAADPLDAVGATDLSADVDFAALRAAAEAAGAAAFGPVGQGDLLRSLGIEARRAALRAAASPGGAAAIDAALDRLTDPAGMGGRFAALALAPPGTAPPPGFAP